MSNDRERSVPREPSGALRADALAPGFLLAPPTLSDPNFDGTLVLLTEHDAQGAQGFVVNRRAPDRLHALLRDLGVQPRVADRDVLVGGPVSLSSGHVLYEHAAGRPLAPGIAVTATLSLTPARAVLDLAARGGLPGRFDLVLGYAGWGAGQLDDEIARGDWVHAPFDLELLFDVPLDDRWQETWARLGVDPAGFVSVRGGAQA